MTFKKTLAVSGIFHVCLFSAALIFSSGYFAGSGEMPGQRVMLVNLPQQDISSPGEEGNSGSRAASFPPQPPERKTSHTGVAEEIPEEVKEDQDAEQEKAGAENAAEIRDVVIDVARAVRTADESEHEVSGSQDAHAGTGSEDGLNPADAGNPSPESDGVQASYRSGVTKRFTAAFGQQGKGVAPGIIDLIGSAIERVKTYPPLARKRGIEGTVQVSFRITVTGDPEEIRITKSSGFTILDRATLRVIKKAAPYPYLDRRVEVPVAYRLRGKG